jgi:lysyl-tRNA synthetase class II
MQEFTAVEHYSTYWNFEDNMRFTEEMFDYIFDTMELNREVKIKDKE